MKFPWKKDRELTAVRSADDNVERVQLWCLVALLALELFYIFTEERGNYIAWRYLERYPIIPAMIFLGASLSRRFDSPSKGFLAISVYMLVWFFIAQEVQRAQGMGGREIGMIFATYGLCLPFAAFARDGKRQRGLKCVGAACIAAGCLMLLYAVLLLLGLLPAWLQESVYWDGTRFLALGHPNRVATVLMLSMAVCMGFFFRADKRWIKVVLLVLTAAQFAALALTNGRTSMVFACVLVGGIVFCALRRRSWKRAVLALLAAAFVMAGAFLASQKIVDWNKAKLQSGQAATVQFQNQQENVQKSWGQDIRTLNSRTTIWSAAKKGLDNNPSVRKFGTEYVGLILAQNGCAVGHTHNSWLQVLYELGSPALWGAVVISLLAVWGALTQLWRNTDLWKSCIAMLVLCLLGCGMLEPYLFTLNPGNHYFDIVFMLCTGYLECWRREGRENTADCP